MRKTSTERTAHPVLLFWIAAGWVGFCVLPWYGVPYGFLAFDWLTDGYPFYPDYAPGAFLIAQGQKLWLAPLLVPMILPRVMVDSNKVKLGTYFYASDILERYSVLGGVAVNARKDLDAYAIFEYRNLPPILFLELYGFTRNIQRSIEVIEDYPEKVPVDIQFNILEADIGARFHIIDELGIRAWYSHQRYTSKIKDFFFQGIIGRWKTDGIPNPWRQF